MTREMLVAAMVGVLLIGLAASCGAQRVTREQLGREVKLRIVVDKVMQPVAGWTTEEWMVREAADAGFNVYSPRRGYDDFAAVRQVTEWCEQYGIYHLVWMRGTLAVDDSEAAQGRMLVWRNGGEQPLWSPCSDEFWAWTRHHILQYALISAENQHLIGVFLDYENYARGPRMSGMVYDLSYDRLSLDLFAASEGVEVPELAPEERYQWLVDNGLHDAFEAWQIGHWRERCRALRTTVDAIDSDFQFCMYPAPGSRFMLEAALPEWTAERAPLIFADAATYGRPTSFLPQSGALEQGRRLLTARMASVEELGLPFVYAGGIDPVVRGADPEYCGRNAVMISQTTDGYWIFYEGPEYVKDHPDYWRWFTWANQAIAEGELDRWREPRETPDPWAFGGIATGDAGLVARAPRGEAVELPAVRLRRRNLLLVNAAAGEPVELGVRIERVGTAEADLEWSAHDLTWQQIAEGTVPFGEGAIRFTPAEGGIIALNVVAGTSSWTLTSANAPVGVFGGQGMGVIGAAERLYFHVPEGTESFTIGIRTGGQETGRVNVYDPTGALVATGQTAPNEGSASVEVIVGEHAGATWALEIAPADTGVLEDVQLSMGEGLPPVLSLIPEHVFRAE